MSYGDKVCPTCNAALPDDNFLCSDGFHSPVPTYWPSSVKLNGVEMPKRIWLLTYRHAGDVCWSSEPNPEDVAEIETVEYVRFDTVPDLEQLRTALKPFADRRTVDEALNGPDPWAHLTVEQRIEQIGKRKQQSTDEILRARAALAKTGNCDSCWWATGNDYECLDNCQSAETADTRPANCRFRLADEGKAYPRSSCQACGATVMNLGSICKFAAKQSCDHDWQYNGTDYHGSHKDEDIYKCRKCKAKEYRHYD